MVTTPLESLEDIETAIWQELARAVRQKHHAWRTAVLATRDGEHADARTVVLRDFDAATRTLQIYADARSPKARQIEEHPSGTLVLWSAALNWQLRLRVLLYLQTSGLVVSSRWAQLKMTPAAHDYLSPVAPGTPVTAPQPLPDRESRENFGILMAELVAVDWLELSAQGQRRAMFDVEGRRWVAP